MAGFDAMAIRLLKPSSIFLAVGVVRTVATGATMFHLVVRGS
jgi:hypothetical protein